VGKRAVEDAAPWKSPRAGLSHLAWKSRKGGGISTSSTAAATTTTSKDFDVWVEKEIADLRTERLVCCLRGNGLIEQRGEQLFKYSLRPS
jgi:hypothetical protein